RDAARFLKGGAIVNTGSITFNLSFAGMATYTAAKGGLVGLTRVLARELGPDGIRVNQVSPGWTMTEKQLRQYVKPSTKRFLRKVQCLPALLQPDEVARVVLFLSSDESRAITGQN